jgi:hypothetical protein
MVDDPVEDDYDDGEEPVPPIPAAYDPIRVIMPEVLAVLHASLGSIELRTLCLSFLRSLSTVMDHKPKIAVELPSIMAALSRQGGTTPPPTLTQELAAQFTPTCTTIPALRCVLV